MSERQMVNEALTLIVAGHETSAITLNWTWYLLSQHPEAEEKLFAEACAFGGEHETLTQFSYSRHIVDESLRLYPAVWLMTRKALHDDWLGDYFVPAGTEIYISPYFIQRHPKVWSSLTALIRIVSRMTARGATTSRRSLFPPGQETVSGSVRANRDAASFADHRAAFAAPLRAGAADCARWRRESAQQARLYHATGAAAARGGRARSAGLAGNFGQAAVQRLIATDSIGLPAPWRISAKRHSEGYSSARGGRWTSQL